MPTSKSKNKTNSRPHLIITLGDPCGIGSEITAKALKNTLLARSANFTVIGTAQNISTYFKNTKNNVHCIATDSDNSFVAGKPSQKSGATALKHLDIGIDLVKKTPNARLITAPLSKEHICHVYPGFTGHTEYLANAFQSKQVGMFFIADKMRVLIATRHIPVSAIASSIKQKDILANLTLMNTALKKQFKIKKPKIAVCGLNPHAGEGGNIGSEEIRIINPAIKKARTQRIYAEGAFAADTLFKADNCKQYDAILAMYHDQGLTPIKTLYSNQLVNLTIGLPIIRTSPAHGTAFNIAGQNKADSGSMQSAIRLAAEL